MSDPIAAYSRKQPPASRKICDSLRESIDAALPRADSKVWHGAPVWFLEDNPVVGYDATAKGVRLLFWNGQSFREPELVPMGKHRAAQAVFADVAEIDAVLLHRWLRKARTDVFDSRAFFAKARRSKAAGRA